KTVVALLRGTRLRSPVGKIGRAAREVVFMISGGRLGALLEAAPGCSVAIAKLLRRPAFVGQVSRRENRTGNPLNQLRGGLGSRESGTGGNVAGSDQHEGFGLLGLFRGGVPCRSLTRCCCAAVRPDRAGT